MRLSLYKLTREISVIKWPVFAFPSVSFESARVQHPAMELKRHQVKNISQLSEPAVGRGKRGNAFSRRHQSEKLQTELNST